MNCGGAVGGSVSTMVFILKRASLPSPSLIRKINAPRIIEPELGQ